MTGNVELAPGLVVSRDRAIELVSRDYRRAHWRLRADMDAWVRALPDTDWPLTPETYLPEDMR